MAPQASKQGGLLPPHHHRIGFCTSNGIGSERVPGVFAILRISSLTPEASARDNMILLRFEQIPVQDYGKVRVVVQKTSTITGLAASTTWERIFVILFLSMTVFFGHPLQVLSEEPPRIVPPAPPKTKMVSMPEELKKIGATAVFPMFDGDGFFVVVPIRASQEKFSANRVFKEVVGPVLASIGFNPRLNVAPPLPQNRIRIPAHNGFARPSANLVKLAKLTCQEFSAQTLVTAHDVCRALTGITPVHPGDNIDRFIDEHMGLTYQQYVDDIQRKELEYFYTQVHPNPALHEQPVPIEHAGVRAARWKGETISSVTGRVINSYKVTNTIKLTKAQAIVQAPKALEKIKGVCCWQKVSSKHVELLLLESGDDAGVPALRYVYRMPIFGQFEGVQALFYLWLDTQTGQVLELMPFIHHAGVPAKGKTFDRSPTTLPETKTVDFEVDPASGGSYTLQLSPLFTNSFGSVRVPESGGGSRKTGDPAGAFANFDQALLSPPDLLPLNRVAHHLELACRAGGNQGFQHIDLMATVTRHLNLALAAGLTTWSNFPAPGFTVLSTSNSCNASSSGTILDFGYCDYGQNSTGAVSQCSTSDRIVNRSFNDHTVVAHEWAHIFTSMQYTMTPRPTSWCDGETLERTPPVACPTPIGQELFHDFADAWAHAIESTPCFGGWFGRDHSSDVPVNFGSNGRLDCASHSEAGGWPRLADPVTDRFPQHREPSTQRGDYADMQIAAAALWAVREGMRSKDLALGTNWYFERFVQTLRMTGWLGQVDASPLAATDWNVYRALVDLEVKLLNQWATSGAISAHNGAHMANKVTAGFAKAGIFLIPADCIDKNVDTGMADYCPLEEHGVPVNMGENGGDAVIDIVDDYLERAGSAPSFSVWTGPAYRFGQSDPWKASDFDPSAMSPSPCNPQYQVEVADNEDFINQKTSGWIQLVPSNGECSATWPLGAADWNILKGSTGETKLYYRVRTRAAANVNERVSTSPGFGLFDGHFPVVGHLPPPYAIVNTTGVPMVDNLAPSTPTGLTATAVSTSQINLAWLPSSDNVGVVRYNLLRDGIQVGTPTTTFFSDGGLIPATPYTYTVEAVDAAGNVSAPSADASAITLPDVTPPSAPTGLTACAPIALPSLVKLTWSPSTDNVGVVRYNVLRNGIQVGTPTTTFFSDSGLSPGISYTYTVVAVDAAGNVSAPSESVIFVPTLSGSSNSCPRPSDVTPPSAPDNLTVH